MSKPGITVVSVLYLIIGLLDLLGGSSHQSTFYVIDNIVVRVLGVLFLIASIGLLKRLEVARQSFIWLLVIQILEVALTLDYSHEPPFLIVSAFIIILPISIIPLIYLTRPTVREQFH